MINYPNYGYGMNSMPTATQPYGYPFGQTPYPQQMQQPQPQQVSTNKTYVSGIEDVKLMKLPPNSEYIFLDNEKSVLYQKKVDANGQFEVKAYEITECKGNTATVGSQSVDLSNYVPRSEFDTLQGEISALRERIDKINARSVTYGAGTSQSTATQTKPTVSI